MTGDGSASGEAVMIRLVKSRRMELDGADCKLRYREGKDEKKTYGTTQSCSELVSLFGG